MDYLKVVEATQCTARVVAYSVSALTGEKIITFELEYPRLIHSELMTHRLFSRNAASSRAIPVSKVNESIREKAAMPVRFGAKKAGMQDTGVEYDVNVELLAGNHYGYVDPRDAWQYIAEVMTGYSHMYDEAGFHKQVCNRLTEPFQYMKTVLTFTGDGGNFFALRNHQDADPTIKELAEVMLEAMINSEPSVISHGEWHLPYISRVRSIAGKLLYFTNVEKYLTLSKAKKISASCCAQVSFRKLDDSEDKADDVFVRLVDSKPVHASPTEHQATPLKKNVGFRSKYVTSVDRWGDNWSGNFRNWGQFRQVIDGNVVRDILVEL